MSLFENPTVEEILREKEGQLFERKSAWMDRRDLANHFVAFANADGGFIAIGIEEDGAVTGISDYETKVNPFTKGFSGLNTLSGSYRDHIGIISGKYGGSMGEASESYRCNVVRPLHVPAKADALMEGEHGGLSATSLSHLLPRREHGNEGRYWESLTPAIA